VSPVLDRTFKVGLVLKAADGVLEIVAGALLLCISPSTIERFAHTVTAHELGEDPHDRLANYILHTTAHLGSGTTLFGGIGVLFQKCLGSDRCATDYARALREAATRFEQRRVFPSPGTGIQRGKPGGQKRLGILIVVVVVFVCQSRGHRRRTCAARPVDLLQAT
jgi:hypothetical protein